MSADRITLHLYSAQQGRGLVLEALRTVGAWLLDGCRVVATFRKETRSLRQNSLMWSCLTDLSRQVTWCGKKLTPEGWKDFITAHLNGQELVPNMDGTGFVAIGTGKSTSDMTIAEMTAVIDLCHAFGTDKGVKWSPTSLGSEQ